VKYREDYRKLHEQNAFAGLTLARFSDPVCKSLRAFQINTVLDFGSGTGASWEQDEDLKDLKKTVKVTLYDPGIPTHETLPDGPFDAVIAYDVLEHVPEDEIDGTLRDIFSRASKLVLLSFCPRGSKKKLPSTGEDVHVTQRDREWWERRISHVNLSHGGPTVWFLYENP